VFLALFAAFAPPFPQALCKKEALTAQKGAIARLRRGGNCRAEQNRLVRPAGIKTRAFAIFAEARSQHIMNALMAPRGGCGAQRGAP
jgi:hypothetical protein